MIDEKKLIKDFQNLVAIRATICGEEKGEIFFSPEEIENVINSQPKIGEWIPCSERLPEEGQRVLATHEGGINPNRQVIEHFFHNGEFLNNWDMDTDFKSPTFGQRYMGDIIAWHPLPEPYMPGKSEEEKERNEND